MTQDGACYSILCTFQGIHRAVPVEHRIAVPLVRGARRLWLLLVLILVEPL